MTEVESLGKRYPEGGAEKCGIAEREKWMDRRDYPEKAGNMLTGGLEQETKAGTKWQTINCARRWRDNFVCGFLNWLCRKRIERDRKVASVYPGGGRGQLGLTQSGKNGCLFSKSIFKVKFCT